MKRLFLALGVVLLIAAIPLVCIADGSRPQVHTVRKGETLRSVARACDVSEKELRRINHLRPGSRLKPGSQLVVRESLPETHTVTEGEALWGIAHRYGLDAEALMDLNLLDSEDLVPGQELALVAPDDSTLPEDAVKLPTEAELELIAKSAAASAPEEKTGESLKDRVIRVAERMLSVPYRWGGSTLKGLDCSAYVQKVYAFLNLQLPRSAREQYREGVRVDKAELSIGDLVFFRTYARYPSHVGIYLGDNRFIHASSRDRKVKIDNLEASYYVKRYIGAKRLLFEENDVQN